MIKLVRSQFEYAKPRLQEAEMVNLLLSKRDSKGRFTPESIHKVWSIFDFGQKKETFEVGHSSGLANIKENLQIEKRELIVRKG